VLFGTAIDFATHHGRKLTEHDIYTYQIDTPHYILQIPIGRRTCGNSTYPWDTGMPTTPSAGAKKSSTINTNVHLIPRILNPIPLRDCSCPLQMPRKLHTTLKVIQKLNQRPSQPPRQRSLVRRYYRGGIPAPRMDSSCS
jgi:hypothetical protein